MKILLLYLGPRERPPKPYTAATPPPIKSQSARSVGAPVNNRETPEPTERYASQPHANSATPRIKSAVEANLFIFKPSLGRLDMMHRDRPMRAL